MNEIEDGKDHLGEWEAFDAGDTNDSEQRREDVIVCKGVEWHICNCISDDVRIQPWFSAKLLWVEFLFSILRCSFQLKWCRTYLCGVELQCQSIKRKWMRQSSGSF